MAELDELLQELFLGFCPVVSVSRRVRPNARMLSFRARPIGRHVHQCPLSEATSQTAAKNRWLVIIRHARVQRNLLIVGCGVLRIADMASGQPLMERPSYEAEHMTAPDQFCSNVRKFLPRHASTPLRRVSLTQKGRALAALWTATLRRKWLRACHSDASDNLTTSPASQFSLPPRIPHGLPESG